MSEVTRDNPYILSLTEITFRLKKMRYTILKILEVQNLKLKYTIELSLPIFFPF